ncbi:hypothetical protein CKA32_006597 [Geitlerinema sp. FC II]|nr:hypothetical protein CKA32_006597 [Geitlerinema sp. FC II]
MPRVWGGESSLLSAHNTLLFVSSINFTGVWPQIRRSSNG